jgi:hypothetical protein
MKIVMSTDPVLASCTGKKLTNTKTTYYEIENNDVIYTKIWLYSHLATHLHGFHLPLLPTVSKK